MTLSVKYRVHHVNREPVQAVSVINGEHVPSTVEGLVVELSSEYASSIVVRYAAPSEVAEAKKVFVVGKEFVLNFE
jgi:hypothetical protein